LVLLFAAMSLALIRIAGQADALRIGRYLKGEIAGVPIHLLRSLRVCAITVDADATGVYCVRRGTVVKFLLLLFSFRCSRCTSPEHNLLGRSSVHMVTVFVIIQKLSSVIASKTMARRLWGESSDDNLNCLSERELSLAY
jgi:hypothetical protein